MGAHKTWLTLRLSMLVMLLATIATLSQMPSLARLIVESNPAGAQISLDSKPSGKTPSTFVVSAARHTVSVSGSANCGEDTVTLQSGETKTITCSGGTWQ